MPKVGMEIIRRQGLIEATVEAIHERGFCDVTVAQIAKRAGVSPALAHHYFGSKDQLLAATMGHLLQDLSDGIRQRLALAETPRARISAIIDGNFAPAQFRPSVIAAWMAFYAKARTTRSSQRILRIYASRLRSNLTFNLRSFMKREHAVAVAEGTASMIDGVWIRQALSDGPSDRNTAIALVEDYVEVQIRQHAGGGTENSAPGSRKTL